MSAPLFGLVLAGGASRRMQADKAAMSYHGKPQLEVAYGLLAQCCERVWISVRSDQTNDPARARLPQIVDRLAACGPLAGISAAQKAQPQAAWLVVACDLPLLTNVVLRDLIARREPNLAATAFVSAHDARPEPLCAIWEPASAAAVDASIARQEYCPRRLLSRIGAALLELEPAHRAALDNVNTPAERDAARHALSTTMKRKTA